MTRMVFLTTKTHIPWAWSIFGERDLYLTARTYEDRESSGSKEKHICWQRHIFNDWYSGNGVLIQWNLPHSKAGLMKDGNSCILKMTNPRLLSFCTEGFARSCRIQLFFDPYFLPQGEGTRLDEWRAWKCRVVNPSPTVATVPPLPIGEGYLLWY